MHGNTGNNGPYVLNFSGNYILLYPPFDEWGDAPGSAVSTDFCLAANICGNTLVSGGFGYYPQLANTNAIILNNYFGNVTYRGIGYGSLGDSLNNAQIYGNTIGQGCAFHLQVPYIRPYNWFLGKNTYINATSNTVPAFLDPQSASVHVYP